RPPHLAQTRFEAACGEDLQAQQRSAIHREAGRYRGVIPESTGACPGPLIDEKSQIQALDRTQPGLPMKKGRGETRTHDYKRHGTTTLFAALNVADGKVIGTCMDRHRHQEWLKFLRRIEIGRASCRERVWRWVGGGT